jgi:prolipoprotein diacylglyceryltransferase
VDFGDGVGRHPTQLYDIAFVIALASVLSAWRQLLRVRGLRFKLFLAAYLLWRLVVDLLKPVPFVYPGGLSGLQWLCVAFLIAYAPALLRDMRALAAQSRVQPSSTARTSLR